MHSLGSGAVLNLPPFLLLGGHGRDSRDMYTISSFPQTMPKRPYKTGTQCHGPDVATY
jgi:hypothetical protein